MGEVSNESYQRNFRMSGAIAFGLIFSGVISQTIKRKGQNHVKNS